MVERFGFDAAACDARLAQRESVPFVVPPRRDEPLSPAELAGWFRLDTEALCAANDVAPGACAGHVFAPGQVAVLPLGRGASGVAPAAPAADEP